MDGVRYLRLSDHFFFLSRAPLLWLWRKPITYHYYHYYIDDKEWKNWNKSKNFSNFLGQFLNSPTEPIRPTNVQWCLGSGSSSLRSWISGTLQNISFRWHTEQIRLEFGQRFNGDYRYKMVNDFLSATLLNSELEVDPPYDDARYPLGKLGRTTHVMKTIISIRRNFYPK